MSSMRAATCAGGQGTGRSLTAAAQRSPKPIRSPSLTVKVACIVASSMKAGTPEETAIWLGPPKVRPPSSSMRNSGRTSPYSGRGASSICSSTLPDTPSTRRSTSCGALRPRSWPRCPGAKAIASIRRTLPVAVVKVVSITSVPGR